MKNPAAIFISALVFAALAISNLSFSETASEARKAFFNSAYWGYDYDSITASEVQKALNEADRLLNGSEIKMTWKFFKKLNLNEESHCLPSFDLPVEFLSEEMGPSCPFQADFITKNRFAATFWREIRNSRKSDMEKRIEDDLAEAGGLWTEFEPWPRGGAEDREIARRLLAKNLITKDDPFNEHESNEHESWLAIYEQLSDGNGLEFIDYLVKEEQIEYIHLQLIKSR